MKKVMNFIKISFLVCVFSYIYFTTLEAREFGKIVQNQLSSCDKACVVTAGGEIATCYGEGNECSNAGDCIPDGMKLE